MGFWLPGSISYIITFPGYQELQAPPTPAVTQNASHGELGDPIPNNWSRGWSPSV